MDRSSTHEMLARQSSDDIGRARFIVDLKRHLRTLAQGNERLFRERAAPLFRAQHGHDPDSIDEIRLAMQGETFYRFWSALSRRAQEMMWEAVEGTVHRDAARLQLAAERLTRGGARGSLSLDPGFRAPRDVTLVNIHCQPGGYMRDEGPEDIMAGALYEGGGNLYAAGIGVGPRDSKAAAVIRLLRQRFPDFQPLRILDLGCAAGGASVGYAASYPSATVHAVDAGPALLRYAHARAEALGVAVHFHQMDARAMAFPDDFFDLVVSHNLMHEISQASLRQVFAESRRVLRPGGISIHQDVPIRGSRTLFEQYMDDWESRYNNEPFWREFAAADVRALLEQAGFPADGIHEAQLPRVDGSGTWYVAMAQESEPD